MSLYIPHKNNTHSWRTPLFIFFVTVFSVSGVYFMSALTGIVQKNAAAQEINNLQPVQEFAPAPFVSLPAAAVIPTAAVSIIAPIEIIKAAPSLPTDQSKNSAIRLEEAKSDAQPSISTGKYIDISLKRQSMSIFEDGKLLNTYRISSGKRGFSTPVGTFKVENKSPKAWSQQYGLWMPNWMAFLPSGAMGIHELPVWPSGYREGANHLGTPVSHGCVRLGVGAAKRVYDWADIGTPIIIHQ